MKKIVFCIGLILVIMVALTSCSTPKYFVKDDGSVTVLDGLFALGSSSYKLTTDENVPIDQCAVVTFGTGTIFVVKEWNNKDIKNDLYGGKNPSNKDKTVLTVPSGDNNFAFDITFITNNALYPIKNLEIPYYLEPGKSYQVKGRIKSLGFLKGAQLYLGLYDVTKGSTLLKEWDLGGTK